MMLSDIKPLAPNKLKEYSDIDYSDIYNLLVNNLTFNFRKNCNSVTTVAKPSLPPLNDFLPYFKKYGDQV